MAELQIYIDGSYYPKAEAKVSVFDHGLLYGDGVFEGIRAYHGQVFLCKEHLNRLYDGARFLCLTIPLSKEELREAIYATLKKNELTSAYVRLVITRGAGDLGLSPLKCPRASVIIIADSIALYPESMYQNGLEIVTVPTMAVPSEAMNPRVKSLNYLNNILAKIEAHTAGVEEAVMLNAQGKVAECTGDNIFIVRGKALLTPPPTSGALEGCTRNAIMSLAREAGLQVSESNFERYDLYTADECFLTGTAAELIPVIKIDGRAIGTGKPGTVTLDLLQRFRAFIADYTDEGNF